MFVLSVPTAALGEPMDPAFERFVINRACRTDIGEYNDDPGNLDLLQAQVGNRRWCVPDHTSFKKIVNQYGFAFAPTAMHSARTTGFGGFHLSIEAAYTKIDDGALYWARGTQGPINPSTNNASPINTNPDDLLQLYSAKIRKSFGFGLEITGVVGFMPQTSLVSGGADIRLSLLEGFRSGIPGILPDVAVGGGVRTITGTPEFQLTVAGLDAQVSKPFPIADSQILTPWIGYQYIWIFGDSGLVDLTPATDPVGYCNFAGPRVPGNAAKSPSDAFDGQPVCVGGSPLDFNNNVVFDKARLERQRLLFGLNYRYEMVMFGIQFITDIVDPADAQTGDDTTTVFSVATDPATNAPVHSRKQVDDSEVLKGEDRQWTIVLELGAMF